MNLIVASYFWGILRNDWATLTDQENFSEVRRLYRYIWMLYGLLMTVFGAQQILRFIFYIPGNVLGELGREAGHLIERGEQKRVLAEERATSRLLHRIEDRRLGGELFDQLGRGLRGELGGRGFNNSHDSFVAVRKCGV